MSCERFPTWRGLTAVVLACALAAAAACADFSRGDPTPSVGDAGGAADGADAAASDVSEPVSFATDVYPLLVGACQKCHSSGQAAGDTELLLTGSATADYAAVVRFTDPSSPAGSRLLAKMRGSGHQGGTVYAAGSPEYLTVLRWIEQGARQP